MDTLKNKTYITYEDRCRYTGVPTYYDTIADKHVFGLGTNLKRDTPYVTHKITMEDNLDSLALKYYNNPTFWWVIAYYNNIQDAFINLQENFTTIKIPNISSIEFGDVR